MLEGAEEQAPASPPEGVEIPEGGGAAAGVLEPVPALAVSPVSEEPAGDAKKKSKMAVAGKGAVFGVGGRWELSLARRKMPCPFNVVSLPAMKSFYGPFPHSKRRVFFSSPENNCDELLASGALMEKS